MELMMIEGLDAACHALVSFDKEKNRMGNWSVVAGGT
jgi:hypothetical protein